MSMGVRAWTRQYQEDVLLPCASPSLVHCCSLQHSAMPCSCCAKEQWRLGASAGITCRGLAFAGGGKEGGGRSEYGAANKRCAKQGDLGRIRSNRRNHKAMSAFKTRITLCLGHREIQSSLGAPTLLYCSNPFQHRSWPEGDAPHSHCHVR